MKKIAALTACALIAFCAAQGALAQNAMKIGVSFSDFETERWPVEYELMKKLAAEKGAELVVEVANHDAQLQNSQIEKLVSEGVNVIIIVAEDGATAASAVKLAADAGIPCISHDRLIKSDKLAAYISFDNVAVGRAQGNGILKRVKTGKFVLLGGSPTDNNAILFRKGQMEAIQPLVEKGDITIVADQWVENWAPANATKLMGDILMAQGNAVDAVVASNDGTALGALQALKAQGLAGKVPISGQDATAAGCKSIVEGELTMTVFKDVRLLTPMAMDMAIKLAKKEKIDGLRDYALADLTLDKNLTGNVPCKFLDVVEVDQSNVYDVIVKSGFQPYDEIYKDIPEDKRPPRP